MMMMMRAERAHLLCYRYTVNYLDRLHCSGLHRLWRLLTLCTF